MDRVDDEMEWKADGRSIRLGVTRYGQGPALLMLPAPSSISTRAEMWPLQERLGARYATLAIDWPGFGALPRPAVDWRPELYRSFLRFVSETVIRPEATVAAGHAAGYALEAAAETPGSLGVLCLLSPTWRGPLPTMTKRRLKAFRVIARSVDLPFAGPVLYRLNVNRVVVGIMARAHVYSDPSCYGPERAAAKREVTEAPGARHASFRFVAGELDPFQDSQGFLDAARQAGPDIALVYGAEVPRKSKAEMVALAQLANVRAIELPRGKLSFYEEFPDETANAVAELLEAD